MAFKFKVRRMQFFCQLWRWAFALRLGRLELGFKIEPRPVRALPPAASTTTLLSSVPLSELRRGPATRTWLGERSRLWMLRGHVPNSTLLSDDRVREIMLKAYRGE